MSNDLSTSPALPSGAIDWRDVFTVVIDESMVAGVDLDPLLSAAGFIAGELTDRMLSGGGREALFQEAAARVPQAVDIHLRSWLGHADRRRVSESVFAAIRGGLAVAASLRLFMLERAETPGNGAR